MKQPTFVHVTYRDRSDTPRVLPAMPQAGWVQHVHRDGTVWNTRICQGAGCALCLAAR